MRQPRWVDCRALLLLHAESLAEHGGSAGTREEGLLDSALARPRHLLAYGAKVDLARLAAAYAAGITRNHPFVDGNKRTGFLAAGLFLELNGFRLVADKADATRAMLALTAGELAEDEFAVWLRARIQRRK